MELRGKSPATGEDLMLGSTRVATFRCSPVLREKINHKAKS
jgi:nucleoid DNA-binding protein